MTLPDYIDNYQHKLETILKQLIEKEEQRVLDIATGFFQIEAWVHLEEAMNHLELLRLLIGRDPAIRPAESDRIDLVKYFQEETRRQLEQREYNLKYKQEIDRAIAYFQQDHIQMRLFGSVGDKSQFLHAKAYIFDRYSIVGSSNFTPSGLKGNSELNVVNKIEAIARDLRERWFEKFWDDPSVDLDYKSKFIDALNASKFGSKAYTPYQVFLKALYELFKEESVLGEGDRTSVELASFQQEGFARAVRLINKHGGCMVADSVGLGKTYIGLRVLDHYLIEERRPGKVPRAMVLCPAQLRDLVWNKKLDEFGIKADVISHEEISRNEFDIRSYSNYDIIVVDESHNFRNSATNRYRTLQKLINSGKRSKKLVLLTATPINNSVFDLYHQILLLGRGQNTYYRTDGISNLQTYFKALSKGQIEITNLLFETMVRRSRQDVIRRQQAGEEIRIGGKLIHFPARKLENFTYNFEASFSGMYLKIANCIDELNLAPYNIKAFKKRKVRQEENEVQRNKALVALQKALYLKRLESGLVAFSNSVTRQAKFQDKFYQILTKEGKLLDSRNFRKLLLAIEDEEESQSATEIINYLEAVDAKQYNLNTLEQQIQADLRMLDYILQMLETIKNSVETGVDYDRKLVAFKQLLLESLKGKKILVFSYFKDTAEHLHKELIDDSEWLRQMAVSGRAPAIELITGSTPSKQRKEKVSRFAPKANHDETQENLERLLNNPIDILICTDVLSEGQNLQDAGVLVNYDLHWNPVRMIQRAGRIDRLGTDYEQLYIYNCFPEEGLEELLGLVKRLQDRIATIDREVGLDASVLGEAISDKSLEELFRLKRASTDAEKQAILEELEQASDLISLDEMRLPLLEYIQRKTAEEVEDIPLGIHSTRYFNIPKSEFAEGGIFLAFKTEDNHYWHFYPRINNEICTDDNAAITDKRQIFNWIKCQESDFPQPEKQPPTPFNRTIFPVLESAINNLMMMFQKQQSGAKIKPALTKVMKNVLEILIQRHELFPESPMPSSDISERIISVIETNNLSAFERDIRRIWDRFQKSKKLVELVNELDDFFVDNELYAETEVDPRLKNFQIIQQEDIKLVCYEWFYPKNC
ncbi:MAG: helicase-related protein [Limnospira sp. PMC 894.15]|uniref:helicase-related protein n=1 Tax=unclassified Limnospira TaxID=2642885 RepID=UPI0028E141A3|nr:MULTISPECIES: helicase-related protein [unclassified Limnospira]MDT9186273.1 helicase-related protein [Limnospira sp. PMC 894.15]MDT9232129.1 helicase-related protein [Limnospira sp. PMC 917.15]